jgi:hypothetical protein
MKGYDWDSQRGLWVTREGGSGDRTNENENDSDCDGDGDCDCNSASGCGSDASPLLLDDSSLKHDETYTASKDANMMPSTTRRESTTRPSTTSKNKAAPTPTDADADALSSMAKADTMISQVAVLLADLHDSALTLLSPAKDGKPKKSSQNKNQRGAASITTKSPTSCSHRPVVVAKDEGVYRSGRDGNIHTSVSTRTSTSTKPVPGKVQGVKETDDYPYGPVLLELAPKVPTRRHKNGSDVRPRGEAP